MTKKTPHIHAEFIKAWANGETIQWQAIDGIWQDCMLNCPKWSEDVNYRIKPEVITVYVYGLPDGGKRFYDKPISQRGAELHSMKYLGKLEGVPDI